MYRAYMSKDGQSYWRDNTRITYEEFIRALADIAVADIPQKAWYSEPHPNQTGGLSAMVKHGR